MSTQIEFDLGDTQAPENKEKIYIKPGFRKLTVNEFKYDKEGEGKTPLITMECSTTDKEGNEITFTENLYMSGKLNKQNKMSSVIRLQELAKGLTGDIITIKPSAYTYSKKEYGTNEITEYTIPNPAELAEFLNKKCAGKTAIFKIGGEIDENGIVYSKLTYSGFLYYTDRDGNLIKYSEERDFTESEYKYSVQKRQSQGAPTTNNAVVDTKTLDEL